MPCKVQPIALAPKNNDCIKSKVKATKNPNGIIIPPTQFTRLNLIKSVKESFIGENK